MSDTVAVSRVPAHHRLQPGDWFQFIFDGPYYHPVGEGKDAQLKAAEVGDIIVWQFEDEPFRRQFRVIAAPMENVLSCTYISRC